MSKLRNPIERTENFKNPAGNIMKELKEAELNSVTAGAGEPRASSGVVCTSTKECNTATIVFICC